MSLFKSTVSTGIIPDAGAAEAFLKSHLGLDTQRKYEKDVSTFLKDPSAYANKKANAENSIIAELGAKVAEDMNALQVQGYPPEISQKKALENAAKRWALEQDILKAQFPSGMDFESLLQAGTPGNVKSGMTRPQKI